jgi:hypothetical protein
MYAANAEKSLVKPIGFRISTGPSDALEHFRNRAELTT